MLCYLKNAVLPENVSTHDTFVHLCCQCQRLSKNLVKNLTDTQPLLFARDAEENCKKERRGILRGGGGLLCFSHSVLNIACVCLSVLNIAYVCVGLCVCVHAHAYMCVCVHVCV